MSLRFGPATSADFGPGPLPEPSDPNRPELAGVEVAFGPIEDPLAIPIVVPSHDPAAHKRLVSLSVVYAPLDLEPAPVTPEDYLALDAPKQTLAVTDPELGQLVQFRVEGPIYGPRKIQVICEDAD